MSINDSETRVKDGPPEPKSAPNKQTEYARIIQFLSRLTGAKPDWLKGFKFLAQQKMT